MALGDLAGRCRVSIRNPQAQGECDVCGVWWPLSKLAKQFQWQGVQLADTGTLACPKCLDRPFEQNKTIILPPDPIPRVNPRPSYDVTGQAPAVSPLNEGFSQYVLGGSATPGAYPTTKAGVLSQVAQLSGVPTPQYYFDRSVTLTPANRSVLVAPAETLRNWLLIYNPTNAQAQIALASQIAWGMVTNLIIGPGEALFWATAQGLTPVYTGELLAIGLYDGLPLWAFAAWRAPAIVEEGGGGIIIDTEDGQSIVVEG